MQDELATGLVIGIASGIITAGFIYFFQIIWKGNIVPWYEKRIYKGINIQGSWRLIEEENDVEIGKEINTITSWSQKETLTIKQTAHNFTGRSTLIPKERHDGSPKTLSLKGEISDRFVTIVMRSPDQTKLSYCTILGQVSGEGDEIVGKVVYYNTYTSTIDYAEVTYRRM